MTGDHRGPAAAGDGAAGYGNVDRYRRGPGYSIYGAAGYGASNCCVRPVVSRCRAEIESASLRRWRTVLCVHVMCKVSR